MRSAGPLADPSQILPDRVAVPGQERPRRPGPDRETLADPGT